jgi:hypothetical protein
MNKFLYAGIFCLVAFAAAAVELTGTVAVNMTSDTATDAKNKAFNSARRDVIIRELRNYANPEQLTAAVKDSSNEDLMNIISSSSVDSEKISDTMYSANISFVIDSDAARTWMEQNSVQNWLPTQSVVLPVVDDSAVFSAVLLQPVADWTDLNAVARELQIDLATKTVVGNIVTFMIDNKDAGKLSSALRANGWRVQSLQNGFKIWK